MSYRGRANDDVFWPERNPHVTSVEAGSSHTNWSLIFDAARGDPLPAKTAVEHLVRRYWPAVFAFIRRSGRTVDEAADLTQGFVCDVILGRGLFQHADPKRGRFRTLLLNSLQNYLRERHRHDHRAKRSGGVKLLLLDEEDMVAADAGTEMTPEEAYTAQWNATLIRRVIERVRSGCHASGLDAHWAVFEARVVRPLLFGEDRVPYARLVERLELNDAGQAANMMITVKRRFVQALVDEIGATVSDPIEIQDEMLSLLKDVELRS